jgi:hypothetical protein
MIGRPAATYIKLLFAAVILWQPVQYALASKFGEGYPMLQLPPFRGTLNDAAGNIRLDTVAVDVLFADRSSASFSPYVLLSPVPSAFHATIMKHMFGPVSGRAVTPINGRWQQAKAFLFPGLLAARAREISTEVDPDTKVWLHRRIVELYPAKEPMSINFVWQTDVYHKTGSFIVTHEPIGVREVNLAQIR